MSSSSNYDTPSPRTHQSDASQNERNDITQAESRHESPVPRRPSFEKLDPTEVAKALQIAELLKTAKSGRPPASQQPAATAAPPQKPKETSPKKPTPPAAEYIPRPPPIPFSGATNPDAVALRATTDILQIQKARATENIQRLEQLKLLNRKDPKAFLEKLVAGSLKAGEGDKDGILGPTVGPDVEQLLKALQVGSGKDSQSDAEAGAEKDESGDSKMEAEKSAEDKEDYPRFPTPQNIIRTPAINWAKYGILGDTLDNMHEEQRTNPTLGEPERLASRNSQPPTPVVETDQVLERGLPPKAPKFVMAAPYDPLKEQLKKSARKPV